jgi:two-component system phosphate regulon sensor histidine kinase PhoR
MKEANPLRIAFYVGLAAGAAGLLAGLLFGSSWGSACGIAAIAGLITFFITRLSIQYFIYRRIDEIHTEIVSSIKNERFKHKMENASGSGTLNRLDNAVRRLIKEKTIEIDNLKDLERMRKEFLGDVAHELRSPIFNIQGYIDTLIEGALQDEEVSSKFLHKAAKHVDHLSSLVEDLVTITRIEAGELKLEKTEFDIKELIREVIELLDLSARQKNISLQMKFPEEPACMVIADRQKIRQVLINLVGNSIKYGRENGNTQINLLEALQSVTVEVADNGEGIAEEHLPRIFERFYRADKSRARTEPSTGLGLAIVKHFIEAHKQKILVTSREGVGSIFSFTLERK